MSVAQHPDYQALLVKQECNTKLYDHFIAEVQRLYPLFGVAHRTLQDDVVIGGKKLMKGSVLCFNYPLFHKSGYKNPEQFDPQRWQNFSKTTLIFHLLVAKKIAAVQAKPSPR